MFADRFRSWCARLAWRRDAVGTFWDSGGTATKFALMLLVLICHEAGAGAEADVDAGVAAYGRGEYSAAFSEFSIAARKDYPFAQNMLGIMYAKGLGVERNYSLAMDWFYKAQVLGSSEAMANLAKMHEEGLGVAQNNATALRFFRDAALAGFQPAMLRLAEIYEKGELGVAPDKSQAQDWRARLRRAQGEIGNLGAEPAKPLTAAGPAEVNRAATKALPNAPARDKTVATRADTDALSEQQLIQRLENYRQRERKLFVASTDSTPSTAAYLKQLRAQLAGLLATAVASAQPEERMIVTLSILRDGKLKAIEPSQASGNPKTDRMVMSSLKKLDRVPPLPAETGADVDVLVVSVSLPIE